MITINCKLWYVTISFSVHNDQNPNLMKGPSIMVPSSKPRQLIYRSWTSSRPPKSSTSKPLKDEIAKFRIRAIELQEENTMLRNTLAAFSSLDDPNSMEFLIQQFETELKEMSQRIDKRSTVLNSIDKKLRKRKAATLDGVENIQEQKTQLIAENHQLVARALYLEKQMISAKLRLRLNHDHRDFCRLKRQLGRLADNDENPNDEEDEIVISSKSSLSIALV